jgi:hypothetical protein
LALAVRVLQLELLKVQLEKTPHLVWLQLPQLVEAVEVRALAVLVLLEVLEVAVVLIQVLEDLELQDKVTLVVLPKPMVTLEVVAVVVQVPLVLQELLVAQVVLALHHLFQAHQ